MTTIIATNRRAFHDWTILETLETGIVLTGLEIKLVRARKVTLAGSYGKITGGELFWIGGEIGGQRSKKLLVHKKQLNRLAGLIQPSLSLIPLKLYLQRGRAKLELGLARRKKTWDKRQQLIKRDLSRRAAQLDH